MQESGSRHPVHQRMDRPLTPRDLLIVTAIACSLMIGLSFMLYGACTRMHTGVVTWLVLIATIWLPGGCLLLLFPFSRWPIEKRRDWGGRRRAT